MKQSPDPEWYWSNFCNLPAWPRDCYWRVSDRSLAVENFVGSHKWSTEARVYWGNSAELCIVHSAHATSSAERAISTMHPVKTYLRSTMTTERLLRLGLMNIYRKKSLKLDLDEVIKVFAIKKNRKLELLFRVWMICGECTHFTNCEIHKDSGYK